MLLVVGVWVLTLRILHSKNRKCETSRMRGDETPDSDSGRMEESSVRRSLETLCQELNMDEQTATEAMENFTAIHNTYTLEVKREKQPEVTPQGYTFIQNKVLSFPRDCKLILNFITVWTCVKVAVNTELKGCNEECF